MTACEKHADQPVVGYSQCPGCEIERLREERDKVVALGKQTFEFQRRAETEAARLRRENEAAASTIDGLRQQLEQVEAERDALMNKIGAWKDLVENNQAIALSAIEKRDALAAHLERLGQLWPPLSADISALFDQQPQNQSDGSYLVDGQSACEFVKVLNDSPDASLARRDARVKAEALEKLYRESQGTGIIARGSLIDEARRYRKQAEQEVSS